MFSPKLNIPNKYNTTTANNHTLLGKESTLQDRKLNDGSTYRIVKVYHEPRSLSAQLAELGWQPTIVRTANYFLYGSAQRAES